MPVLVTGASGLIGRKAIEAFGRVSPQVRAYVRRREAVEPLRALGAKVAVGPIEDVDNLETAMTGVHTVCHLVGGLDQRDESDYEPAIVGTLRPVLAAATRAGVRRVLFLSYPGASPGAANPYLRSKGLAEEAIRLSGIDSVILRSTHVYGPGGAWLVAVRAAATRRPAVVVGSGCQVLAPVLVDDVAGLLAAADDRESSGSGLWGVEGPDRLTADQLSDLLGSAGRRKVHLRPAVAARLSPFTGRRAGVAMMEVLAADSLADAPDAFAEFGLAPTRLAEGLAGSLARQPSE
jgi:uncharacterized protein YbjT (DUF2867 family)